MEEKSFREEIRELKEMVKPIAESKKPKSKKFRLPSRSKVNKSKLKKGYATVMVFRPNKEIDFIKEKIVDNTIRLDAEDDLSYHAIDDPNLEIYTHKGKPFIIQDKKKSNPYNFMRDYTKDKNETYGQKYIISRMETDQIKQKKSIGNWMIIIGVVVLIGIIAYAIFTGGGK